MTNSDPQFVRVLRDDEVQRSALFTYNGDFFVYSYVNNEMAHETMVFASDENGHVRDYTELFAHSKYVSSYKAMKALVNTLNPVSENRLENPFDNGIEVAMKKMKDDGFDAMKTMKDDAMKMMKYDGFDYRYEKKIAAGKKSKRSEWKWGE